MYPYLFEWTINGKTFRPPTFGALVALSFSVAYFLALFNATTVGLDPRHIENLFLVIFACSVIGSRLFHVAFEEPAFYWEHPEKIFAFWEGGYTFYGAVLLGLLGIYIYSQRKKISYLECMDICSTSTALGLAIGRVGCFFAGCCWGKECHLPWAVRFTNPEAFNTTHGVPVHPTQLYEAFGAALIFLICQKLIPKRKYNGQVFFISISLYAILRFIVEYFRGDAYRGFVFEGYLSYSQLVSVVILPFALIAMQIYSKQSKSKH